MRCLSCDKTISQKDRFCRYCGKAVTPDAIQASRLREDERYHGLLTQSIVACLEPGSDTWGAHIYEGSSSGHHLRSRPRSCPDWVEQGDWDRWFHEGLVVWDNATHQIGAIHSSEAVELLDTVLGNDEWKITGIPIIERSIRLSLKPDLRPKRSKRKPNDSEESVERPKSKSEIHEDERLRLTGAAAQEFAAFLRTHEARLRKIAAERKQRAQEAITKAWEILLRSNNEREANEIGLAGRSFRWQRRESGEFVADVPPDRATIRLVDNGMWWQPIIERPGHFKLDYQRFFSLEEAMQWAEAEVPRLRSEDEAAARKPEQERSEDLARVAALATKDLTPFWIDPVSLEPAQITYRAYIELEYGPAKSTKHEISFGEYWHFEKQYFTGAQLAVELRLNTAQVDVQQLDPLLDMYRIYSWATYADAPVVAALAQQIWNQSAIVERFAEKKVKRARFGYQELETKYCVWLGWLEQEPWPFWASQESRVDYMKDQAMFETICAALDVNGYRKYLQLGFDLVSDEDLIWKLHYHRSKSKFSAAQRRAESLVWLEAHPREG